jgi:plastocyanin
MRSRLALAPVALLLSLAVAAPASAAEQFVNVVDFDFQPENLQINPGDTVTWTFAVDGHTSTANRGQAESWDSGPETNGANTTFSHTFDTPGRYGYLCVPHGSFMTGVVQVGRDEFPKSQRSFKQTRRGNSITIRFRLVEPAKVTAKQRGPNRRTITRRRGRLEPGRHSIKFEGLRDGRYRGTVTFEDDFKKKSVVRTSAVIR